MMKHLVMALVGAILGYPGFYIGKWIVENLNVWQWVAVSGISYGLFSLVSEKLTKRYNSLGDMLGSEMKEVKIPKIY